MLHLRTRPQQRLKHLLQEDHAELVCDQLPRRTVRRNSRRVLLREVPHLLRAVQPQRAELQQVQKLHGSGLLLAGGPVPADLP